MKRSYISVALLCAVLMLDIIFTQYMVHQYFFEHYQNTIIAAVVNIILFPVALYIYKRDKKHDKGMNAHE